MAGQNRNKFEEYLILLSQGNLTYEQANDSVLEPMQRQALLFALANVAALSGATGTAPSGFPYTLPLTLS